MSEEDMINPLELLGENEYLRNQLQQKENIIKEVREYIYELKTNSDEKALDNILDILDKENK